VSNSLTACFALVLGDIEVNGELQSLPGVIKSVGALFFWTYMILVFLVLLNFLLAIIVDAFSEVKKKTSDTIGVPEEITHIAIDKVRSAMRMCGKHYVSDRETRDVLKSIYKARKAADESQEQKRELLDQHSESEARKTIPVGDKHITAESLANLFYTILEPATMDEEMPGKPSRPAPTLKVTKDRCLPCCGKKEETPDLSEVANALVERFGEYEDDVDVEQVDGVQTDSGEPIKPGFGAPPTGSEDELMRRLDEMAQDRDRLARQVQALLAASPQAQAALNEAATVSKQKLAKGPGRSRLGSGGQAEPSDPQITADEAEQIRFNLLSEGQRGVSKNSAQT
jgi:phenylpyruvate tautomerase PptA (4-oxalocrotonate tautomerase family)